MATLTNLAHLNGRFSLCRFVRRVVWIVIAMTLWMNSTNAVPTPATMPAGSWPARSWNVTDFGAVGDSRTMATDAIHAAIQACSHAGGGRVVVPSGTFLCAPIQLLSNVDLHLDAGATLLFSRSMDDYPLALVDNGAGEEAGCRSPIWGENLQNISITGSGVIDGQGSAWRPVKKSKLSAAAWNELVNSGGVVDIAGTTWYPDAIARDDRDKLGRMRAAVPAAPLEAYTKFRSIFRPNLVRLSECRGVVLDGVTFRESASWNIHLALCDDVQVRNVSVFNPAFAQNGDGIDVDSCRNVLIADSRVDAGDDAICLKSGTDEAGRKRARPTENVTITRCTVGTGHGGVVIGSEMSGGVRNINVSDCVFRGTDNGLRFKSVRGRGGVVENVNVNHVDMSDIHGVAILFDMYYFATADEPAMAAVNEGTPVFRQFSIRNVTCKGAHRALQIRGLPEMPLEQLTFDDIHIDAKEAGAIVDAKDITLRDVHIETHGGSDVVVQRVERLYVEHSTGIAASSDASAGQ